jgi:hypothetical protein
MNKIAVFALLGVLVLVLSDVVSAGIPTYYYTDEAFKERFGTTRLKPIEYQHGMMLYVDSDAFHDRFGKAPVARPPATPVVPEVPGEEVAPPTVPNETVEEIPIIEIVPVLVNITAPNVTVVEVGNVTIEVGPANLTPAVVAGGNETSVGARDESAQIALIGLLIVIVIVMLIILLTRGEGEEWEEGKFFEEVREEKAKRAERKEAKKPVEKAEKEEKPVEKKKQKEEKAKRGAEKPFLLKIKEGV